MPFHEIFWLSRIYDQQATEQTRPHYQSHKDIWDETRITYKEKFGEGKLGNPNIPPDVVEEEVESQPDRFSMRRPLFSYIEERHSSKRSEPTRMAKSDDMDKITNTRSTFYM